MPDELFETSNVRWGELVSNGRRLLVPTFQRNYAWNEDNWEDLWSDLTELRNPPSGKKSSTHYMGSIVIQQIGDRRFYIIDGQQRLTTLSLLALAVVNRQRELSNQGIDPSDNKERADLNQDRFLGSKDPTTLIYDWKMKLNRSCNDFYQHYLMAGHLPRSDKKLSSSEALLFGAYKFFQKQIVEDNILRDDGARLSEFLDSIVAQKTMFIQVKVQNDVNAYLVFETLNARGIELTPTDLIKNYLFSLIPPVDSDIDYVETHWQNIGKRVSFADFPEFMRHYVNSTRKLVRSDRLFREIKDEIRDSSQVVDFLRRLEAESETYEELMQPENEAWKNLDGAATAIEFLNLISIKQLIPVLLAVVRRIKKERWASIFNCLGIFMFRYSTIGRQRNRPLEPLFSKLAVAIHNGEIQNQRGVQGRLQELYLEDSVFANDFARWTAAASGHSAKLVRYILAKLDGLAAYDNLTIEHIGPKRETADQKWCSRLGNYALLEPALNREARGKDFSRKTGCYQKSLVPSTSMLSGAIWTEEQVSQRQQRFAARAVQLWRFSEG